MNFDDLSDDTLNPEADQFLADLVELIDEEHVQYARDTLEGIAETVEKKGYVTEAQKRAVENIDDGGQRGMRKRRRY